MERVLNVIPGEAPESDDEEVNFSAVCSGMNQSLSLGRAVTGEAPESDSSASSTIDEAEDVLHKEESAESVSSAVSALATDVPPKKHKERTGKHKFCHSSLLHKKLRERNVLLRRGLEDFVNSTVDTATKDLNSIDQHLLKSQVTLQEAVSSLRLLEANLTQIQTKMALAASITLPVINTKILKQLPGCRK